MPYLSNALVLASSLLTSNSGRLCFRTIVTSSNIAATSELEGFPASNMSNPGTSFGWEAEDTADQTITITNDAQTPVDYIGIARHNLGQSGLEIRVRFDGSTVLPYASVGDQQSLLYLISEATPTTIQIDIRGASNAAKIAVIYVGLSMELQRGIYVGHTPIVFGRDRSIITGVSQSGEYLGEIELNRTLSTGVSLQNLTPDWYRANLDEFFGRTPRDPCFFAWRPGEYPAEVSYCWIEENPRPVNQRSNGMMSASWNLRGIA